MDPARRSRGEVAEALEAAVDALRAVGVEEPRLDAEVLLAEAMGVERAWLLAAGDAALPAAAGRRFGELVRRRLRREPVAYVTGRKGFRRIELAVDRRVLVPRPETELLVEVALERRPGRVLDVGTGSGAIALAVADELPGCEVVATDTSPAALEVARANAERLGLADRVAFLQGTLPGDRASGDAAGGSEGAGFDLVLANLPYIPDGDWTSLQPEVRDWEPREALLAGADGLDAYRQLLRSLHPAPVPTSFRYPEPTANSLGGVRVATAAVAVEIGIGQAEAMGELMREAGFGAVEVRRDLAGIERVVIGEGAGGGAGEGE